MGRIEKEGLRDLVYKELLEMIENSRFTPGARITVERITEELGVSRTPVWQAVGLLEKEGLVRYVQNKGVFVNELTTTEAIELYMVREGLESMAAGLAIDNITAEILEAMEKNLKEQEIALENKDLILYSQLDFSFHAFVYNAANNKYLIEMLELIKKKMRPLLIHLEEILDVLIQDHISIYMALKQHDREKAIEGFHIHNQRMREKIIAERQK
ncbi:MAG: GntR family transcriptional regulator [Sphaerochaeta sp.]|nr:GntR family transcriptional regulator [Sphaerochaeta sp.]